LERARKDREKEEKEKEKEEKEKEKEEKEKEKGEKEKQEKNENNEKGMKKKLFFILTIYLLELISLSFFFSFLLLFF